MKSPWRGPVLMYRRRAYGSRTPPSPLAQSDKDPPPAMVGLPVLPR
jgi:hypothetical protein